MTTGRLRSGLAMALVSLLGLLLFGCSSPSQTAPATEVEVPSMIKNMKWASGAAGGVTYPLAAQVCELISNKVAPGSHPTILEGTAGTNAELVNSGECALGHTNSDVAFAAIRGRAPFKGEKTDFRAFARVMDMPFQFIVASDMGVDSFDDIIEKKVKVNFGTSTAGSSADNTTRLVLDAYGISYDFFEENGGSITYTNMNEGAMLMKDGHINAWACVTSAPSPYIEEMRISRKVKVLPVKKEVIDKLVSEYGYAPGEVKAGVYGAADPVPTIVSPMILIAHKDIPDDFIYDLTKAIMEPNYVKKLTSISSGYSDISPEYSSKDVGCEMHPGAEKYYRDQGVL